MVLKNEFPKDQSPDNWNKDLILKQNYPNPFNLETHIRFYVSRNTFFSLNIYDVHGRLVRTLCEREKGQGNETVQWNGTDNQARAVSSGIYFFSLKGQGFLKTMKAVLIK